MKAKLRKELESLTKIHKILKETPNKQYLKASLQRKRVVIEEAKSLLTKYRTFVVLDNTGVPSKLYTYIRQRYGDTLYVRMIKNRLFLKALKELNMPNVDELTKYLQGSNMIIFTNMNPFETKLLLDKISVPYKIKPGEKIEHEIIVPSMKTELKPGPIMSLFGKLKIPIQVRDGVIWITREATIAKPGDIATIELIALLEKLGIEPKILKPKIKVAYEGGLVIPVEKLVIDIEGTRNSLVDGLKSALSLAVELVIPEPNIVRLAIARAYLKANSLAVELGVVTKETAPMIFAAALRKAYTLASVLSTKIPELQLLVPQGVTQQQQVVAEEKKVEETKKEEEEKAEVTEEQLAEGLASLFG